MKRPAVRNVRALRAERELVRARAAHAQARVARQKAASHRLVVACALLGALLGVCLVAALSPFPWWPVLVPTALLAISMTAGHRAALASAQAEQRERARIAELEAEVVRLTGRALPESAAEGGVPGEAGVAREAREMSRAGEERAVAREAELGLERGAAAETGEAVEAASVVETVVPEAAPAEASPVAAAVAESSAVSAEAASAAEAGSESAAEAAERDAAGLGATVAPAQAGSVKAEPAKAAPVAGASTPPQGWEPVSVPAPTYTLVGTARRRRLEALSDLASSAPAQVSVPARPVAARPVAPVAVVTPQAPIDLDAVLERRRASGE